MKVEVVGNQIIKVNGRLLTVGIEAIVEGQPIKSTGSGSDYIEAVCNAMDGVIGFGIRTKEFKFQTIRNGAAPQNVVELTIQYGLGLYQGSGHGSSSQEAINNAYKDATSQIYFLPI